MRDFFARLFFRRSRYFLFGIFFALSSGLWAQNETALDRYVREADPAYEFSEQNSYPGMGYSSFVLRLQTLQWHTIQEVDLPFWQHWLRVTVPTRVTSTTAILIVNGGSQNSPAPGAAPLEIGSAAASAGVIIAELYAIPNQPLHFKDGTPPLSEDALIAYSWDKYLRTGDEKWPLQLPMTKAVVRAMNAVQEFAATEPDLQHTINKFVIGGGSKRGWTSWLAAAADPESRVMAVAPVVFDALNLQDAFRLHWQSYGFWSPAVSDYEDMGIFAWLYSRPSEALMNIADPFRYRSRQRLTIPKYLIYSAGDEFFVPAAHRYFGELQGQTHLRYVPNTSHSMEQAETDVLTSTLVWAQAVIAGASIPQYSWEFATDGRIILRTESEPSRVRLWRAENPNARDFRYETIGQAWEESVLQDSGGGVYQAPAPAPQSGWAAYFIEAAFPSGGVFPFVFTTPIRVAPDTLPYGPPLVTTLAASYDPRTAPDSIASAFGADLAGSVELATTIPLPTNLAGTRVRVRDANGVFHNEVGLFGVSPAQVNYLMPIGAAPGIAWVEVLRNGTKVAEGQALVEDLAPGLFSANDNGEGVAKAFAVIVRKDQPNQQEYRFLFEVDEPAGSREPEPLRLTISTDVYLSLWGTGMRKAQNITATVGGKDITVQGFAPSPEFEGVDQINIGPLPIELARSGEVDIVVSVDGKRANIVTVDFF